MNKVTVCILSLLLAMAPTLGMAKEGKESRHVVVNGKKHHGHSGHSKSHNSSHKRHHYSTGHNNYKHRNHSYNHSYRHYNNHHHYKHKRRHRKYSFALGFVLGSAIHGAYGRYGYYHNGHPWCPSHSLYHTHAGSYTYHHDYHYTPRKVESYIELDEGRCYRVTEYSNGDQKRKRIRYHHCADLELEQEWDDWDDPE